MGLDSTQYSVVPISEESGIAPNVPCAVDSETPSSQQPQQQPPPPSAGDPSDPLGFHFTWGADNSCTSCELTPCCGSPANFTDGLYCCVNFTFCSPCALGKLAASSAGVDECAVVNHCLPWYLFGCLDHFVPFLGTALSVTMLGNMRRNLRTRAHVGRPDLSLGDLLMHCLPCLAPCAMCQEIRSVPVESWDWMRQVSQHGIKMMHDGPFLSAYVPSGSAAASRPAPTPMSMSMHEAPAAMPSPMSVPSPMPMQMGMPMPMPMPQGDMMPPMHAPYPVAIPYVIGPDGAPVPYVIMPGLQAMPGTANPTQNA